MVNVNMTRRLLDDDHVEDHSGRTYYAPSGWRKTIFAFLFLLLLPFTFSIPMMLYQRVANGVWLDTWGLIIVGLGLGLLTLLVLFEFVYSLRAEVEIGEKAVRFTVPQGAVGLFPNLFYRTEEISYADIERIEHICEVHGGSMTPVMMNCTRIITKDGRTIPMGSCNEQNPDHTFPYHTIALQIAERAGIEMVDRGHVRQRRKFALIQPGAALGEPEPMEADAISSINRRHQILVWLLAVAIAGLLALGIFSDLTSTTIDTGERAADTPLTR
ncbi:MAG: hypothetical protein AAGC70_11800 [Pseudomonadota bacterium]